jgi:hypothetical protein
MAVPSEDHVPGVSDTIVPSICMQQHANVGS